MMPLLQWSAQGCGARPNTCTVVIICLTQTCRALDNRFWSLGILSYDQQSTLMKLQYELALSNQLQLPLKKNRMQLKQRPDWFLHTIPYFAGHFHSTHSLTNPCLCVFKMFDGWFEGLIENELANGLNRFMNARLANNWIHQLIGLKQSLNHQLESTLLNYIHDHSNSCGVCWIIRWLFG